MKSLTQPILRAGCALALLLLPARAGAVERQTLTGHVPAVVPQLRSIARLDPAQRLELSIALPLRNRDALTGLLRQIYDPAGTNFHHYLTPDQFAAQFGPTAQDYQALQDFAGTNGLTIGDKSDDRTLLHVSGPASVVEKAFHVSLNLYKHPNEARQFFAPDREPSLDLAAPVLSINGLDNYAIPQPGGQPQAAPSKGRQSPRLGSGPSQDYNGYDFRKAYIPGVTLTGTGQAVGLLELDGYYLADITNYENAAGIPLVTLQNVAVDNFNLLPSTNANRVGEVSLDIEVAIAMAPGLSKVIVYETANNTVNFIDILHRMATDNAAKQLSSSWFIFNKPSADQYYLQFAAQGQSFFQCSGDNGAFYSGIPQYADNTNITVVGGTTLNTTSAGGPYQSEIVWNNNDGTNGGGGGISVNFDLPDWQKGTSMASNNGSTTKRNVPDVALVAQNVHVIWNNGTAGTWWGTSIAAPMWAAYTALVNQQAVADGRPTLGFLNPALYSLGNSSSYATIFHDVTAGNNTNNTVTTLYSAVAGYDLCTGWGTPTAGLITALENYAGATWVDFSVAGPGSGTFDDPYNTLPLGIANVPVNGAVEIKGPSSTPLVTNISKPLILNAHGGPVTIGQ